MQKLNLKLVSIVRRCIFVTLGYADRLLNRNNNLFILCYHSIGSDGWRFSVKLSEMEKQMKYLLMSYEYVTLTDIENHIKGKKVITKPSFSVTFDDGYTSVMESIDMFKKLHIKPTAFVLSDPKNANRAEMENQLPLMSFANIKKLHKSGWTIGSHTMTHPHLTSDNNTELEINKSKKTLEKKLGIKIRYFAYPKGGFNTNIIKQVKNAGYKMALSVQDGEINSKTNIFAVPRIGVDGTHNFREFKLMFSPSVCKIRGFLKDTNQI